jgi:TonB family protein
MIPAFFLLGVFLYQAPAAAPALKLFSDGAKFSQKDGVIELRGSRGHLRTSIPLVDFDLSFEFRAITPEVDAGLVLRSFAGWKAWPEAGYRLTLPTKPPEDAARLFTARRKKMLVLSEGRVELLPDGEWQRLRVVGNRRQITVGLNGEVLGVFEVESVDGLLMFENRKGAIQLRNISIRPLPIDSTIADSTLRYKQLLEAKGQPPDVIDEIRPTYTDAAMRRKVEGNVVVEAVVLQDGSIGAVRVTRSLDPDLDLAAVAAVRGWKFRPGILDGRPVDVVVEIDLKFTLR